MIVSWNWLSQYVRLDMPVEVLAERLALAGLNHESTEEVGGDLAVDLEVTSNRPDCLGHIGVAREVGVLFGVALNLPDPRPAESGAAVESLLGMAVEDEGLCPRFTARVVTELTVRESPWWLRKRLGTLGVRPVNNVVDVTNYVMFEAGQPLHAYDLDRLAGRRLVVRKALAGETLRAINGKTYELAAGMLVVADGAKPAGLAGVMGGLDSEIGTGTTAAVIEAARFDPMSVRKTARALGLFSPSSYRFERPLDPEATDWASRRCAELVLETAGGILHPGLIDLGPPPPPRPAVTLRLDQIERVLGITIDPAEVDRILLALGLEPTGGASGVQGYRPPSWRSDLGREIDLIEEVARVHGYDAIPEDRAVPLASAPRGLRERVESLVRDALTACGLDEAVTFSLVDDRTAEPVGPGPSPAPAPVRVEHSSRRRDGALRQSLVPSLLAARAYNETHGNADASLFEIADVYLPGSDGSLPEQPVRLGVVSGRDFFGLKGVVEALLARLHADGPLEARPCETPWFTPGRSAELSLQGETLGYLGEVRRDRLDALGLRSACTAAELDFGVLERRAVTVPQNQGLAPYPAVDRDLSLVLDAATPWAALRAAVTEAAGPGLEAVDYLDTFAGGNVPPGRRSVHFGLRFRRHDRTLTGDEVERQVSAVVEHCADRLGAALRT